MNNAKIVSPVVKVEIEQDKSQIRDNSKNNEPDLASEVSKIVGGKKCVLKQVEIVTKTTYTFDDGTTKETTEKINHSFKG